MIYTEGMPCEHKDGYLQAKEKGMDQIFLSQPSEWTHPDNIVISEFWPQELRDNKFLLLLKSPCLWYFVTVALKH